MINLQNLTTEQLITRAKTKMYKQSPFFAYIVLHMKVIEDKDGKYMPKDNQTMAVDSDGNLYYNEKWVKSLEEQELIGVIGHEALHIALLHLLRGTGRDHKVFNQANDLIVNDILLEDGFSLPKKGLIPDRYHHSFEVPELGIKIENINEKSSEEIYDELMKQLPPQETMFEIMSGSGSGGMGLSKSEIDEIRKKMQTIDNHIQGSGGKDGEGPAEGRLEINKAQKWKRIVAEATQIAKQQGKLPAGIARRIDDLLDSKINWKTKLYKYVVAQIPFDYSWGAPAKKSAAIGVYLPRVVRESVKIVVSIDTSGSIGENELKEFLGELLAIGQSFPNINIDLIICDAEVHETYQLNQSTIDDIQSLEMSGGGGTSHEPVLTYIEDNIHDIKVLINFSDGYTSFGEKPMGYDVLWVISKGGVNEKDVPYGEVIKLD